MLGRVIDPPLLDSLRDTIAQIPAENPVCYGEFPAGFFCKRCNCSIPVVEQYHCFQSGGSPMTKYIMALDANHVQPLHPI